MGSKIDKILKLADFYKKSALTKAQINNNISRQNADITSIIRKNQQTIKEISKKIDKDFENIINNIEELSFDVMLNELTDDKLEKSLENIKNIENFFFYLDYYLGDAQFDIARVAKTAWPELKTLLIDNSNLLSEKLK